MKAKERTGNKIHIPIDEEDRKITAAAHLDPDCPPMTEEELSQMVRVQRKLGRPNKAL